MDKPEELYALKEELCKERDLCAELCNVWIGRMYQSQNDKAKYEKYLKLINDTEPYTQGLKAEIAMLNKRICEIVGADNISDTEYTHTCVSKYGFDFPKT